jgi:hypothetical protein
MRVDIAPPVLFVFYLYLVLEMPFRGTNQEEFTLRIFCSVIIILTGYINYITTKYYEVRLSTIQEDQLSGPQIVRLVKLGVAQEDPETIRVIMRNCNVNEKDLSDRELTRRFKIDMMTLSSIEAELPGEILSGVSSLILIIMVISGAVVIFRDVSRMSYGLPVRDLKVERVASELFGMAKAWLK